MLDSCRWVDGHTMCAVDMGRLAVLHQHVCLRVSFLFLAAAITLGTLAQAAAGTQVVTYPPHLYAEACRMLRFHFPSRLVRTAPTAKEPCAKSNFLIWGVVEGECRKSMWTGRAQQHQAMTSFVCEKLFSRMF